MTNIKERALLIAKYQGVAYEKFFEIIGMSYGNFKGAAKKTPLNSDAIGNILTIFKDVNPEWLILGSGEMLRENLKEEREIDNSDTQKKESVIVGEITIDDFRSVYKQGIIVAEAHKNFSIAAIKTADAAVIFAETGKKQTDSNSELVGLLKKFFNPPVNFDSLSSSDANTRQQTISQVLEKIARKGVEENWWPTLEDGLRAMKEAGSDNMAKTQKTDN